MWDVMRAPSSNPALNPNDRHPEKRLNAVRIRNTSTPGRYADGNGLYLVVERSVLDI
jgi:hypothetical protein